MVRGPRGRPQPEVIIEALRHRLGPPGGLALPVIAGDADTHGMEFADSAVADQLAGKAKIIG
ncbi:hypothetical protein ES703_88549 [subsurface metagenome]